MIMNVNNHFMITRWNHNNIQFAYEHKNVSSLRIIEEVHNMQEEGVCRRVWS